MNIYAEHEARRARIMPALAGSDADNRVTEDELAVRLGEWARDDAITLAATGAIRGSCSAGYYIGRTRSNGRS